MDRILALFEAPANEAYLRGRLGARVPELAAAIRGFGRGPGAELVAAPPGRAGPRPDAWGEVRRLNRAFLAHWGGGPPAAAPEPYHVRAFEADSLARGGAAAALNGADLGDAAAWGPGEEAWGPARPDRSAAEAWAEYFGEAWAPSGGSAPQAGLALGGFAGPGAGGGGAAGGRFMRREGIPFWQKGGREGLDREDSEGFPDAREHLGQVRRWEPPRA